MTRLTPQWLQNGIYAASIDRRLPGALWPTARVQGMAVTASSGMVVNVAAGQAAVPTQNNTGSTLCTSDAVENVTVNAAPASGTDRVDLIVVTPRGFDLDGGGNDDFIFRAVAGTPAASGAAVAPAVPAGSAPLAQILLPGGSVSITAGNITDRRPSSLSVPPPASGLTQPRGIIVSGPVANAVAANGLIPVNTVIAGAAAWLNAATGTITIPAGAGGLYAITLDIELINTNIAANKVEVVDTVGVASANPNMAVRWQVGPTTGMFIQGRMIGAWLRQVADAATFKLLNRSNPPTSHQVMSWSFLRIGDALALT